MRHFKWNKIRTVCGAILALAFFFAISPAAHADGIDGLTLTSVGANTGFTITGTYTFGTPTTAFSSPNAAYVLTFMLPTTPSSFAFQDTVNGIFGIDTTAAINGVSFTNTQIVFFVSPLGGGVVVCLSSNCSPTAPPSPNSWDISGEQLFSGSVLNPSFISGAASIAPFGQFPNSFYSINGHIEPAPEPSSLLLLGISLLGLGTFAGRKLLVGSA